MCEYSNYNARSTVRVVLNDALGRKTIGRAFGRRRAFRYVSELPSFLAKQPGYGDAFDVVVLANVWDFRSVTA